jgi:hypothetical protein
MELLTAEKILEMFCDFGLAREEERHRFLSMAETESLAPRQDRALFIRADSTADSPERDDAELA